MRTVFEGKQWEFTVEIDDLLYGEYDADRNYSRFDPPREIPLREQTFNVYLPHCCEPWPISGSGLNGYYDSNEWVDASDDPVENLESFIAEAQEALVVLKREVAARETPAVIHVTFTGLHVDPPATLEVTWEASLDLLANIDRASYDLGYEEGGRSVLADFDFWYKDVLGFPDEWTARECKDRILVLVWKRTEENTND